MPADDAAVRFSLLELDGKPPGRNPKCTCPVGWFPRERDVEYSWRDSDASFTHHFTCAVPSFETLNTPKVRNSTPVELSRDTSPKITHVEITCTRVTRPYENNKLKLTAELRAGENVEEVAKKLKKQAEDILSKLR